MAIADLAKEGRVDGIANVNDESGRQGMRIVVDVKRDDNANVLLNKLFKLTALQSSFSVNCIALVNGRPRLLSLKECVKYFVEHRHDVTIRRTQFELKKAQERAHILEGLIIVRRASPYFSFTSLSSSFITFLQSSGSFKIWFK